MKIFNEFIEDFDLVDLPSKGVQYTWSINQNRQANNRIDRFLFSPELMDHSSLISQEVLPNPFFDHVSILLNAGEMQSGPRPFRFEIMWLSIPGFEEKIRSWWNESIVEVSSFIFRRSLIITKGRISAWKKTKFGKIEDEKKQCLERIKEVDKKC